MARVVTLSDYMLEILNRRARERGEDVELVYDRPKPRVMVRNEENVVKLDRENAG
jgi:hypothetical protein